jgi:CheY-like chemotaxis protein
VEYRTVLFVDNDKVFLGSVKRCLLNEPYRALFARSCKEALGILQEEKVDVIVTDIRMPDIDGRELLRVVGKTYPHVVKVVISAYINESSLLEEFDEGEIFSFIAKSWQNEEDFVREIRRAVESCYFEKQSGRPAVGGKARIV